MDIKNNLIIAFPALLALLYRLVTDTGKSARYFLSLIILAIFMSMVIAPAAGEHYDLSLRMTSGLSGILVLFAPTIIDIIEKKLPQKLNDKIDKL
jgi:hypothetical protein